VAVHTSTFTLRDYDKELGTVTIHNGAITSVSIAGFLTAFGALRSAIDTITNGVVAKEMWVGDNTILSNSIPTGETVQRENKWLVVYEGDTSKKKFQVELPTADPTGRLLTNTNQADLADTDIAAFVTAFEAIARSPDDDTETVTVLEIRYVQRRG
jgi:hypothetical protein